MDEAHRYKVEYERDLWGWTAFVADVRNSHVVYHRIFPMPLKYVQKRVAKAIAEYERGESYIAYSS